MSPSSEGCLQTLVRIQKGRAKQTSKKRVLMQDSSNPDEQTYFFSSFIRQTKPIFKYLSMLKPCNTLIFSS